MNIQRFKYIFDRFLNGNIAEWNYFTQFGRGLSDDGKKAQIEVLKEYIERSSETDQGTSTYLKGYINFIQAKYAEEIECYALASDLGNPAAMLALANIYKNRSLYPLYNIQISQAADLKKQAAALKEKAANSRCLDAVVYQDVYHAFEAYPNEAKDSSYANTSYGYHFEKLDQFELATEYYKKAIELDDVNTLALRRLGDAYKSTHQIPEAKASYRKAVTSEDSQAMISLANLLAASPDRNLDEIEILLRQATALGNHWAMQKLAVFLDKQNKDSTEIEPLFERAAELGNYIAMDTFATYLQYKDNQDPSKIKQLYNNAIAYGYREAKEHLKHFEESLGTTPAIEAIQPPTLGPRYTTILEKLQNIQFSKIPSTAPNLSTPEHEVQFNNSAVEQSLLRLIALIKTTSPISNNVVEAMEALYAYFEVLAKKSDETNTDSLRAERAAAQANFKEKINHLPGHPNPALNAVGIAFLSLGALILAALATTAGLGLIIPSAALATPAIAGIGVAMVSGGLIGMFASSAKQGSHYSRTKILDKTMDEDPDLATRVISLGG
jgi:Tfp pilus assembly protein PilF